MDSDREDSLDEASAGSVLVSANFLVVLILIFSLISYSYLCTCVPNFSPEISFPPDSCSKVIFECFELAYLVYLAASEV